MPIQLPLIVHERRNTWAAQIRPRAAEWTVRVIETRSVADLSRACLRSACPILVVDLGDRPARALADLARARELAPNGLALVVDPAGHRDVPPIARELGATHVFSGRVTPPTVLKLLEHWISVAVRRAEGDGWADEFEPDPEPWEALLAEDLRLTAADHGEASAQPVPRG